MFANLHLLDIQNEHSAEDLESDGALATEDQDLVVSDLVCEAHVARDPVRLVTVGRSDLLPDVLGNVIALDCVHNLALVDTTAKREDEVVLEAAQSHAGAGDSETVDLLPLVLSDVVHLAEAIDLAVDEGANDVDEALQRANRVICMRVDHARLLVQKSKDFIVTVALLEVLVASLVATADQVDAAIFSRDGSRIQRNVELHLDWSFLKRLRVHLVDVGVLLVPLERMHSGWDARLKTVLDVVVDAQTGLNQVFEVTDDLICVLVIQSLQFGIVFKFVEELLEFRVEVKEHFHVMAQRLQQLRLGNVVSVRSGLLHLAELLTESLVELRHLLVVVLRKTDLLLVDHFSHFRKEIHLVRVHRFL